MQKELIHLSHLSAVPYTLLIPLAIRSEMKAYLKPHELDLRDLTAERIQNQLTDKGKVFLGHRTTVESVIQRTRFIRRAAEDFLKRNPDGAIVNLGCGLSDYFQWLDVGSNLFIDADLDEVIDIREKVIPPKNSRHFLRRFSLTSQDWWRTLDLPLDRPLFFIWEGVSMYLKPHYSQKIFLTLASQSPPQSELVFDYVSALAVGVPRKWNPVLKHTQAHLRYGLRSLDEVTRIHPNLVLLKKSGTEDRLGLAYRIAHACYERLTGTPIYGLAHMKIGSHSPNP